MTPLKRGAGTGFARLRMKNIMPTFGKRQQGFRRQCRFRDHDGERIAAETEAGHRHHMHLIVRHERADLRARPLAAQVKEGIFLFIREYHLLRWWHRAMHFLYRVCRLFYGFPALIDDDRFFQLDIEGHSGRCLYAY